MTQSPSRETLPMQLKLPQPWSTNYTIQVGCFDEGLRQFQIRLSATAPQANDEQLQKDDLFWTELSPSSDGSESTDSTKFWNQQETTPTSKLFWTKTRPSIGQVWLAAYGLITLYPTTDSFKISLHGEKAHEVGNGLCKVGLLVRTPSTTNQTDYFLFRGSFWQGAGSPFGARPVWLAEPTQSAWEFPPVPLYNAQITDRGQDSVQTVVRQPKPEPGTVVYSRYVPHATSQVSLQVLEHQNKDHINLFHTWNRHGTYNHHYEYLQAIYRDPNTIPVLVKQGDNFLAYFEIYWVKDRVEDQIGVHFEAEPFDRGCNVLFPEASLEDTRTVNTLWSSLVHYLFLDEPRTMNVFGTPKYVNSMLVGYEADFPFSVTRRVDSPTTGEALAVCSREMFFQICPFAYQGEVSTVASESKEMLAKL